MGTSAKTLSRLAALHGQGLLKNGASIMELGAQELYCAGQEAYVREIIRYFAERNPSIRGADSYTEEEIRQFANRGLFGKVMSACGFVYKAMDIFDADNTILFDLNLHTPGPELVERFDLVTNFGTTEHVINQYLSMKTIHEMAKPGGLIYHDLPFSGYHNHGYFSYNPLLFRQLAEANGYRIVMQHYSRAVVPTPAPSFMTENGYPEPHYLDAGIEFIFQKTASTPFRMPLETSTSLDVSTTLWGDANPYTNRGAMPGNENTPFVPASMAEVSGWDLQRELLRRYRRKLASLLGLS